MRTSASARRHLYALGLVLLSLPIALLGRVALDEFSAIAPRWASEIEHFGGWAIGMIVGLAVVIPVCRLYGVIEARKKE